jgi:uncharacterized protein
MYHANNPQDIYFWRDSTGHEVDLLIDMGTHIKIVEMKAGMTIMPEMFKTLEWFETISRTSIKPWCMAVTRRKTAVPERLCRGIKLEN